MVSPELTRNIPFPLSLSLSSKPLKVHLVWSVDVTSIRVPTKGIFKHLDRGPVSTVHYTEVYRPVGSRWRIRSLLHFRDHRAWICIRTQRVRAMIRSAWNVKWNHDPYVNSRARWTLQSQRSPVIIATRFRPTVHRAMKRFPTFFSLAFVSYFSVLTSLFKLRSTEKK